MKNDVLIFNEDSIKFCAYTRRCFNICYAKHKHTFWEINYVLSGEIINSYKNQDVMLKYTDISIVRPQDVHYHKEKCKNHEYRDLYVPCDLMRKACDIISPELYDNLLNADGIIYFKLDSAHINSIEYSAAYFDGIDTRSSEFDEKYINLICRTLLLYIESMQWDNSQRLKPEYFVEALRYIDKNCTTVTCDEIIRLMGYSKSHVNRMFLKYRGESLRDYIVHAKIQYGANLVLNRENKIVYIANILGYSSQNSFDKAFKKYYKCSPKEYREKFR